MRKIIGRILRVLAWIAPVYQFRASVWKMIGISIGRRVYIGNFAYFDAIHPNLIIIEDEVSIGSFTVILAHSNGSLYHQRTKIYKQDPQPVLIKQGAWIASGAIILPGVTVGKAAIVGAGAVVSNDVKDYAIVVGNPARPVGKLPTKLDG
jgi:acetyltransferase-like isoleucine patch superfamily enzyme